jgi:hypothetical protein
MGEENVLKKNYREKEDTVFKPNTFFVRFMVLKIIKDKAAATMPEFLHCSCIF